MAGLFDLGIFGSQAPQQLMQPQSQAQMLASQDDMSGLQNDPINSDADLMRLGFQGNLKWADMSEQERKDLLAHLDKKGSKNQVNPMSAASYGKAKDVSNQFASGGSLQGLMGMVGRPQQQKQMPMQGLMNMNSWG